VNYTGPVDTRPDLVTTALNVPNISCGKPKLHVETTINNGGLDDAGEFLVKSMTMNKKWEVRS
jgi:hypothetical protein